MVVDYTRLNIKQVLDLNIFDYWLFLRDAYIYKLQQTEEGRNYLKRCWTLSQAKPNRKKLREKFGKNIEK